MGEHTEWMKYNNFEISHKAPMLLHVPGTIDKVALVKMFGSNHPPHVTTSLDDVLGEPG